MYPYDLLTEDITDSSNYIDMPISQFVQEIKNMFQETKNLDNILENQTLICWIYGIGIFEEICSRKNFGPKDPNRIKKKHVKELAICERQWGQKLQLEYNDKKNDQWSGQIGEKFIKELIKSKGHNIYGVDYISQLEGKSAVKPDIVMENNLIEIKTRTYFTPGTAGEKLSDIGFKYNGINKLNDCYTIALCVGYQLYDAIDKGYYPLVHKNHKRDQETALQFLKNNENFSVYFKKLTDIDYNCFFSNCNIIKKMIIKNKK